MSNRGCSTCSNLGTSKHEYPCNECTNNRATDHYKPMTNADAIRNMTDEELATVFAHMQKFAVEEGAETKESLLEFLQAEVKEGNSNEKNT